MSYLIIGKEDGTLVIHQSINRQDFASFSRGEIDVINLETHEYLVEATQELVWQTIVEK